MILKEFKKSKNINDKKKWLIRYEKILNENILLYIYLDLFIKYS